MDLTKEIDEILGNARSPFGKIDADTQAQFCHLARSDWKNIVEQGMGQTRTDEEIANLIKFLEKCDELSRGIFIMMFGLPCAFRQLKEEAAHLKKENTILRRKVRELKKARFSRQ